MALRESRGILLYTTIRLVVLKSLAFLYECREFRPEEFNTCVAGHKHSTHKDTPSQNKHSWIHTNACSTQELNQRHVKQPSANIKYSTLLKKKRIQINRNNSFLLP